VPEYGLPLYNFLDNHDQPRIASNVSNPAYLTTLYTLLYTLPGVPSIYYGSEWGIKGVKEADSDQPLRPYIDIENPPPDDMNLSKLIKKLATIRRDQSALKYGGYRQIFLEYQRPFVFERFFEDKRIFIAINITANIETINLDTYHDGALFDLVSLERIRANTLDDIAIEPYSAKVLLALY
jgi:glycosidase